jgi:Spy/CpxP family protein refolding chaperone
MSKRLIYLLLAVSLGLNVGMISMTLIHQKSRPHQGPLHGPGVGKDRDPGHPWDARQLVENHVQGITRHLGLDPQQQKAIRTILERHAPQLVRFQADVAQTGRRLAEAYAALAFDPEQFRQLTAEASAARSKLDSLSAVMLVTEAAVLTPEQRLKFAEVAPSIHSHPQPPPGRGEPPPHPTR